MHQRYGPPWVPACAVAVGVDYLSCVGGVLFFILCFRTVFPWEPHKPVVRAV